MLIYATPDDLTAWWGKPAPDNAVSLLRAASNLVARETRTAVYATTYEGFPDDPPVAQAFSNAVTAQSAFWASNGIDPTAGRLAEVDKNHVISKQIKGASIGKSVTLVENANKERSAAVTTLCDEAWLILDNAGLVNGQPV